MCAFIKIMFLSGGGVQGARCLWPRPCWIPPGRTRPSSPSTCWLRHTAGSGREENMLSYCASTDSGTFASPTRGTSLTSSLLLKTSQCTFSNDCVMWFLLPKHYEAPLGDTLPCVSGVGFQAWILVSYGGTELWVVLYFAFLLGRSLFRRLLVFQRSCHRYSI